MANRKRGPVAALVAVSLVVVLVAAGFVADGWARGQIERRVNALVGEQARTERVSTAVLDRFVLPAGFTDRLQGVQVDIEDAIFQYDEDAVEIDHVRIDARDLTSVRTPAEAVAGELSVSGTVDWTTVGRITGVPVTHVEGNRVALETTVQVMGRDVSLRIEADLGITADGGMTLDNIVGTAAGLEVPDEIVRAALLLPSHRMHLPELSGMAYTGLQGSPEGLTGTLHGTDVVMGQLV